MAENGEKKTLTLGKAAGQRLGGTLSLGAVGVKKSSPNSNKVVVVTKAVSAGGRTRNVVDSGAELSSRGGKIVTSMPAVEDISHGLTEEERLKRISAVRTAEASRRKQEESRKIQAEEERLRQLEAEAHAILLQKQEEEAAVNTLKPEQEGVSESVVVVAPTPKPKPEADTTVNLDDLLRRDKIKNLNALYPTPRREVSQPPKSATVDEGQDIVAAAVVGDAAKVADSKTGGRALEGAPYHKKLQDFDEEKVVPHSPRRELERRVSKKFSAGDLSVILDTDGEVIGGRRRSLASINRAKSKQFRKRMQAEDKPAEKIVREVSIPDYITVGDLANRMAEKAADVIKKLMSLGMIVTINQLIDADTAELVISEFGHKIKRVTEAEIEAELMQKVEDDPAALLPRAPVVTIMGHVDHGKTSLLDALRNTDVAAGEAGGITQHIGAYQVTLANSKVISFLDTPGHEAFTAMRMRGARVTDIVVLVVAADDGIMQQTIEAISHARAAKVAIIVAINKIDKPDANPERVRMELLQHNVIPESMGGDIIIVEVSAKQRLGLDKLEEMILLQAEMLELKANPNKPAEGAVIEAKVDKGKGTIATLLVQSGTVRVGDIVVAGTTWGKVRALMNDKSKMVESAGPSMPIEVWGLEAAPVAGDEFLVVPNEKSARDIVALRLERDKQVRHAASKPKSLDIMLKRALDKGIKELPVIIKGDVQGSVEAIANSLQKLGNAEIAVRVLHQAVGGITESDVTLATASDAIVIGFNVRANAQARELARVQGVDIRYYSIIYNLVDDVKAAMGGMLSPMRKENVIGYAEVRDVFDLTKSGKVAGCYVTEGVIKRNANARIIRDNVVIYDGKLKALKRFKDDVREVGSNFECGLSFENYEDIKVGDRIEAYEVTEQARVL